MRKNIGLVLLVFALTSVETTDKPKNDHGIENSLKADQNLLGTIATVEGKEKSALPVKEEKPSPETSKANSEAKNIKLFTNEGSPIHSTGLLVSTPSNETASSNLSEIVLTKVHRLQEKAMTFNLPEDLPEGKMHIVKVTGAGEMLIELFSPGNAIYPDYAHSIILDNFLKPSLIPISAVFISKKNSLIRISSPDNPIIKRALNFELTQEKAIPVSFNENFKIHTSLASEIHCLVSNPTLNSNSTLSNRLQFIMETSLESQTLYGGEEAEMFINESPSFPTKSEYQLKASGSLGTGLIKTISPGNEHYCFKDNCIYYVTIYTNGLSFVNFFPSVFANGSLLKFHHYLFLIEEIEPFEKIEYELEVPKIEGNWVFSVIPTMGSIELLINPDFKPESPDQYKYMVSSHRPEEIIITAKEAKEFGFSHERFFIRYKSYTDDIPAAFRFEVKRYDSSDRKYIKENYAEGGVVAKNEIINYYLDLGSDIPQTLTAVFKLDSYSGHADLYIKECFSDEFDCKISLDELVNFNDANMTQKKKRISRSSNNDFADKANPNKKDMITLNFNCAKFGNNQIFQNHYPTSKSCLFAIGVHCRDSTNKFGAYYKLVAHGQGIMAALKLRSSTIIKAGPSEKLNYRINIGPNINPSVPKNLIVKIVAITGVANIFFSKTNENPDATDNESSLSIQNESLVSLRTSAFETQISLAGPFKSGDDPKARYIYMSVDSSDYSVLDVYADIGGPGSPSGVEKIREANILHRKIESLSVFSDETSGSKVYYANFLFEVPERDQYNYYIAPKINISVNSQIVGIKICVQENKTDFDPHTPCSFQSSTDHLALDDSLTSMDKGKNFLISIQKIEKSNEPFSKFPIDFTLSLNSGISVKEQELHLPGKTFSSILNSGEGLQIKIDLRQMTSRAQIYFYASDPNSQANVGIGQNESYFHLASLDQSFIGVNIQDATQFKLNHCRRDCLLRISIYDFGAKPARFSLLYVIDDLPIILKEGDQIIVANNIDTYFAYEADDTSTVSFSTYADRTLSVIYSKSLPERSFSGSRDISQELTDISFDFKTNIESAPRIVYPKDLLQKMPNRVLGFFVQPKFHFRSPSSNMIDLFSPTDALTVYLHSKSQRILPFILTDGQAKAGEFVYYFLTIDHPQDFSVILTLHSGEAGLFMAKGDEDFPTDKRFWKRANGSRGDEISVLKESFERESEMVGNYVIGVRGNAPTNFSLLFMPEFKNLIKMRFQRLIDLELTKDKNYYFDFFNTHESYNTLLFAEDSDIEVSALNYDESKYQDFITMVTNEDNYLQKFTFKKGDLPRKKFFENSVTLGTHIVVRVKAIEHDARINFAIFDGHLPILVPVEKRFTFVQDKNDTAVFKAQLDSTYEEVDLDIKLEFGSVTVYYSESSEKLENQEKISIPSQKYFAYKVEKITRSNDFMIFKEFYIHVTANEFSKFSILVKPKDKFKQLKAFEPEIIYTNPEKDIYVYFHITTQKAKSIHNLLIDFNSIHYFDQRPELLFLSESDVVLDENSPYLPMPLLDLISRDSGEFKHLEIRPDVRAGFFVLKIEKFPKKLPIKISVSLNNHKNIEINGLYHGSIPQNQASSHSYGMFIPRAGEFRLVLESCSGVKIDSAEFFASHSLAANPANEDFNQYQFNADSHATSIKFEDGFVQGYSFLFLNETQLREDRDFRMLSFPVRRGFVNERGVLRFKVVNDESRAPLSSVYHGDEFYVLLSEFRPNDKELILKDYVKIFEESDQASRKIFGYHYKNNNAKLAVTARLPAFKPQLLVDYPRLKSVKVKVWFYLLADLEVVQKLEHCGQSMIKTVEHDFKIVEKEFSREILAENKESEFTEVEFDSEALAKYRGFLHLNVLGYISVRFFEDEDDEFNVNLDFKYTNVPYFLMTIPNRYGALLSVWTGLIIAFLILLIFFAVFYVKSCKEREGNSGKTYSKTGSNSFSQSSTKLEMSSISRSDRDN